MSPDGFSTNKTKIQTQAIRVIITTDDYDIEGFMHIKPGGYQSRVSDLLNAKELHFVPITNATCQSLRFPDTPPRKLPTVIVKLDTIKMVVPLNTEADQANASPDASGGVVSGTPFGGSL